MPEQEERRVQMRAMESKLYQVQLGFSLQRVRHSSVSSASSMD
jgi:hypothetical protein